MFDSNSVLLKRDKKEIFVGQKEALRMTYSNQRGKEMEIFGFI